MPNYEAKLLDGSVFRLSDRRSKVVLLNVWATWCGPCRYEIPELQAMHEKYSPRGLEVVGVSIDDPGMESDVRTFVQGEKMTYPVVLDPQGRIAELFETTVIPTSVLIDRSGTIVWMHRGIVSAGDRSLQQALQKAL
jgi:thiol-disulfide isomerase/thioredoxin